MMKRNLSHLNKDTYITILYYLLFLSAALSLIIVQPLGEAPDETLRYLIPQFICKFGTLPTGYEPEVLIPGYGGSYAFQPILSYIIMGFLMRFLSLFSVSDYALLLSARLINLFFGICMAYFVKKASEELFQNRSVSWLFCFIIMFLPENIFMHTYVNTDSMALLSSAIIVYAWIRLLKDNKLLKNYILLSLGIILCALSYYNSYGFILCSIILFIFLFLNKKERGYSFDWKTFWQRGLFTTVLVLLGVLWWFIRSYQIYDGDFIGLSARTAYAIQTANPPEFSPLNRITHYNTGYSLFYMLFQSDYLVRTINSFIAVFGPANLCTSIWVYRFYKLVLPAGLLLFLILYVKGNNLFQKGIQKKNLFHIIMFLSVFITLALAIGYSYASDYQPQGRYWLPMVVPFMYFVATGIGKLITAFPKLSPLIPIICIMIILCVIVTFFIYIVPYYLGCYSPEVYERMLH